MKIEINTKKDYSVVQIWRAIYAMNEYREKKYLPLIDDYEVVGKGEVDLGEVPLVPLVSLVPLDEVALDEPKEEKVAQEQPIDVPEVTISHEHPPCSTCGGVRFRRTGVCFVCENCGSSGSCS